MHASARGMARLAAAMANRGQLGRVKLLSRQGWEIMHQGDSVEFDAGFGCRTQITNGGLTRFERSPDDNMVERKIKSGRDGFLGWCGIGGSILQWHPGHNIGFAYTCTELPWWDNPLFKAGKLQKMAVKCALEGRQ